VAAGRDQRGGLAARHFLRKAGAAERARQHLRRHLALDFVRHQARGAGRRVLRHRLEALAQPADGHRRVVQQGQRGAQAGHGRGDDQQVGLRHGLQQLLHLAAAHGQLARQRDARQVARVLAPRGHGLRLDAVARPQHHLVAGRVARRADGQRRAPGTSTDYYDFHSLWRNTGAGLWPIWLETTG
jgi:hypothetical protein